MVLTLNIKVKEKLNDFLDMLEDIDYVEVVGMDEKNENISEEQLTILKKRLDKIEQGKSTFKDWDTIKKKYEKKTFQD
jgi:hypothetical protein